MDNIEIIAEYKYVKVSAFILFVYVVQDVMENWLVYLEMSWFRKVNWWSFPADLTRITQLTGVLDRQHRRQT